MITSFKKIIESEGFEPLKKVECDKWLGGVNRQFHVTAVMNMGDNTMFVWYEDFFERRFNDDMQKEPHGYKNVKWTDEDNILWASTKEEMEIDRQFLQSQKDAKRHNDKEQCYLYLKQFLDKYEELGRPGDIDKDIREDKRFENFRQLMEYYWCRPADDVDDDVQSEIARIFKSHIVRVCNKDTHGICVTVNLDHAHTVQRCQYDGQDAICIGMGGDEEYHIYRENDEDTYKALCVLYDYCI